MVLNYISFSFFHVTVHHSNHFNEKKQQQHSDNCVSCAFFTQLQAGDDVPPAEIISFVALPKDYVEFVGAVYTEHYTNTFYSSSLGRSPPTLLG